MDQFDHKQEYLEDPRFRQCNREALYGVILGGINVLLWLIGGYGFGRGNPENFTYILGFPAWFFISCILNALVAIAGTIFIVRTRMKDMPLDPMTEEEARAYQRETEDSSR